MKMLLTYKIRKIFFTLSGVQLGCQPVRCLRSRYVSSRPSPIWRILRGRSAKSWLVWKVWPPGLRILTGFP